MTNNMIKHWVSAFRLRTLPLALASIGLGSFLAASDGYFHLGIFALCCLTTIFLQILSNLANDYGDTMNGADNSDRQGPQRAVQSGAISVSAMRHAIIIFALLSFITGLSLLFLSIQSMEEFLGFLGLGVLAIIAAITYTAGKKPYGYAGLGDISVYLFFGCLGVLGSYYLFAHTINWNLLLPASTCGLFATAVLNVNNIRDIESDRIAGKKTIPARIGKEKAVRYHLILLGLGLLCAGIYSYLNFHHFSQLLYLVIVPLIYINGKAVYMNEQAAKLDPYLKQMALTTLLFVIAFGTGEILAAM